VAAAAGGAPVKVVMLCPEEGYVVDCDVDANDGYGYIGFSMNKPDAKQFDDFGEALAYWKRQSTVRPLRADGKPNRPLSAYTVTFEMA
jgi:hypothetical protein